MYELKYVDSILLKYVSIECDVILLYKIQKDERIEQM